MHLHDIFLLRTSVTLSALSQVEYKQFLMECQLKKYKG